MNHEPLIVTESDIMKTYKEQGRLKSYRSAVKYSRFLQLKDKIPRKKLQNSLNIHHRTLAHWLREDRVSIIFQVINDLKRKGILPLLPSERLSRIVGYVHGDGWITDKLKEVGFSSSETSIIKELQDEMRIIFNSDGDIKTTINKGETVIILGKKRTAKKDSKKLLYCNTGIARTLFIAGGVKGKKTFKTFSVPNWIINGKSSYKRGFLNGLFDSEMSKFQLVTHPRHENNILQPRMEMCKCESLLGNLKMYFNQIKKLLEDFEIEASIKGPTFVRMDESEEKIYKYTLLIKNNLKNLHNFITKIGFYSSAYKREKSDYVLRLIKQKIKSKNKIYDVLSYIIRKHSFTTKDLQKDLKISSSYTKILAKFLWNKGLTKRTMKKLSGKEYVWWYEYVPIKEKIKKYLEDEIMLLTLEPEKRDNKIT